MCGVSEHRRKNPLLPVWHRLAMPALEDVFMPHIVGDVVEPDGATSLLCLFQKARESGRCMKPK
jgi:hypothetical protein